MAFSGYIAFIPRRCMDRLDDAQEQAGHGHFSWFDFVMSCKKTKPLSSPRMRGSRYFDVLCTPAYARAIADRPASAGVQMNVFVSFLTFVVQSVIDNTTAFVLWITRFRFKPRLQNPIRGNLKREGCRAGVGSGANEMNSSWKWSKIGDIASKKRGMRFIQC